MKNIPYARLQPWQTLFLLVSVNLIIGFSIGDQYGQTWDEPSFYIYGERSYDAYMQGLARQPLVLEKHILFLDLRYYGPVHTATGWKIVETLEPFLDGWGYMDLWHFINFVLFQIALVSLYFLAKRFVRPWTALFVVLLFETQPLLFGHAFINPKDIPFLTFFLASVTAGLYMADAIPQGNDQENPASENFSSFWLLMAVFFGLYVFTYLGKDLIYSIISSGITAIYFAPGDSFMGRVFSLLTGGNSRLPVENYIHKASAFHLERIALCLAAFMIVGRKIYLDRKSGGDWKPRFVINLRLIGLILFAGAILGLTTSIRLLAPFAGVLIVVYAAIKKGRDAAPTLIGYGAIAGLVSFTTWPFLWDSPSLNFLEAIQVMRDFPYNAEVRFMGDNIAASSLPWYYIIFLICVQVTVPALILAGLGVVSGFGRGDVSILFAWFAVPLGLQILLHSNVYDNFRQFLFVLPPLFVLAGIGLERFISSLKISAWKTALPVLCILPGIYWVIALHPYQYIYYNAFVGGVSGAEGDFELDYWLTSYRQAGKFINEHASPNANILAWGSGYNGAREDLDVYSFTSDEEIEGSSLTFEYAVISTRFSSHLEILKDAPVVYEVRKNGVLLAVVKKLNR